MKRASNFVLVSLAALTVASCGSSDGGGVTGSGFVIGPISGFGSIVVNGIEIDVSHARITIDETRAREAELAAGMVVEVRGEIDDQLATGTAGRVVVDPDVRGPVDDVNAANETAVVLGQTVVTDAETVFDGTTLADMARDDVVEVNGFIDAGGSIRATRISAIDGHYALEARGFITSLDKASKTFVVGVQLIGYGAADLSGVPSGGLRDGLFVEVESRRGRSGDVLIADRVDVESGSYPTGVENVSVQGLVTDIGAADEFVVDAVRVVRTTEDTVFENGTADDLAQNERVRVVGQVENDVVVATLVSLLP